MKKLVLLCMLLMAAPAFAQNYYGLQEYGLRRNTTRAEFYGGVVLPAENWDKNGYDLGTTGWTAGLGFTRNLMPYFGLGLDGNYAQLGNGDKDTAGNYYRAGVVTGLITGRVTFFPSQATRLYVPFGAGLAHTFVRQKLAAGGHGTYDGTDLAGMLGAGLEFDLDDNIIFGIEARYYYIKADDDVKGAFGRGHYHHYNVMLKLGSRF